MKTKSFFFLLLFAASAIVLFLNCSGDKKEAATESHEDHQGHHAEEQATGSASAEASEPQFQVDRKFQNQLSAVFTSYVGLKEAFVSSDAEKVQQEAARTNEALADVDMKLLTGAAHNDWMNYLAPMRNAVKEIESGQDIEARRKSFSTLSNNLYKSVKAFGLGGEEAFYEYCPMAFNDEGAYWLSDEAKIRNPYFGDKMLTCGVVKEKLK
jgi:hypothetical protein